NSLSTSDSRSLTISYEVKNFSFDSVAVNLVRSGDARFDIYDKAIQPTLNLPGDEGTHTVTVDLAAPLAINPSRPFVMAQVDPLNTILETSEVDNTAFFRTRVLGVVTHGFNLFGGLSFAFPTWTTTVAANLRYQGYDRAFAFDWTALSNVP